MFILRWRVFVYVTATGADFNPDDQNSFWVSQQLKDRRDLKRESEREREGENVCVCVCVCVYLPHQIRSPG